MTTQAYAGAIAATRDVLANTDRARLSDPTPCAQWSVADLINHIVGGQAWFHAGITGASMDLGETDYASGDFLALGRELPEVKAGDLLVVFHAGAYGFTMASNYNTRPRPAEVLVQADGTATLVRRRETYDDLLAAERL